MMGSLFVSLANYVTNKHGQATWNSILTAAGLPVNTKFISLESLDDVLYFKLVDQTKRQLGLSEQQIWDVLGNYWILEHTDKHMPFYYRGIHSACEFLMQMNDVHQVVGRATAKTASPPEFTVERTGERELTMTYKSQRKMLPYFLGLIKAVAARYNEQVTVRQLSENQVHISFAA